MEKYGTLNPLRISTGGKDCVCKLCERDGIRGPTRGSVTHHMFRTACHRLGYYGTVEGLTTGLRDSALEKNSQVILEYRRRARICRRYYDGEVSEKSLTDLFPVASKALAVKKQLKGAVGMENSFLYFLNKS
jgi:hypothetical protein